MLMVSYSWYPFFFHLAQPWKLAFCRNYPMLVLLVLNVGASIALFYITKQATEALGFVEIAYREATIVLVITYAFTIAGGIFNFIVDVF